MLINNNRIPNLFLLFLFFILEIHVIYGQNFVPSNQGSPTAQYFSNEYLCQSGSSQEGFQKPPVDLPWLKLSVAGNSIRMPYRYDDKGNPLVSLKSPETLKILDIFSARITYLEPFQTLVISRENRKDFRIKMGETTAETGKDKITTVSPPVIIDDEIFIPLDILIKALDLDFRFCAMNNTYYMDPFIEGVSVEKIQSKLHLFVKSSAPLKYRTYRNQKPGEFIIEIENVCLKEKTGELNHPEVGNIEYSQISTTPNRVEVRIPQDLGVEVEMVEQPSQKNTLEAFLLIPEIVAPVGDLKIERITDMEFTQEKDRLIIDVTTSGPFQFEWRRLVTPDNRFIIEFPMTDYTPGKKERKYDLGYLTGVTVERTRTSPVPASRITLELTVSVEVVVTPDMYKDNKLKIQVLNKTITTAQAEEDRRGYGVTSFSKKGIVICIDPGHGGGDPGACNSSLGLQEKQLTLDISLRLQDLLKKAGWNVVMTRQTDRDVAYAGCSDALELGERVRIPNSVGAQIFVSIHVNASVSSSANGTSCHYYKSQDLPLAQAVQKRLLQAGGRQDNGVQNDSFYVIRNTVMPAVLVECAFISNYSEAILLSSPDFRQKLAVGIFNGLMDYAESKKLTGKLKPGSSSDSDETDAEIEKKKKKLEDTLSNSRQEGSSTYDER